MTYKERLKGTKMVTIHIIQHPVHLNNFGEKDELFEEVLCNRESVLDGENLDNHNETAKSINGRFRRLFCILLWGRPNFLFFVHIF